MMSELARLRRMAATLCRQCGIAEPHVEDAAVEVALRAYGATGSKRNICALHAVRKQVARQLGVPVRAVPARMRNLKALGSYTRAVRLREDREDDGTWRGMFDYHSRRFAIENNVCPRCARRGEFTADGGRCVCGFSCD